MFALTSIAQEVVIFERNDKTEHLFDERNPLSLLSILQQNASYFNYYDIEGIDPKVFADIPKQERDDALKFVGPQSDLPLVDEYGEYATHSFPDGTISYVYPAPDSMFIDLENIDKIVFTLHDGQEEPMQRLNKLQIWKNYSTGMHLTLSIDASKFMTFEGIHFFLPLDEEATSKLVGNPYTKSLWNALRDSSLSEMKRFENGLDDDGVFFEKNRYVNCSYQQFFMRHWYIDFRLNKNWKESVEPEPYYFERFDYEDLFPFSSELTTMTKHYSQDSIEVASYFDRQHYILAQSDVPLVDEYGEYMMKFDEDGMPVYVYETPRKEYFFLDYSPTVFLSKQVIKDKNGQLMLTPNRFFFCAQKGENMPEIASILSIDLDDNPRLNFLKPFLTEYQPQEFWSISEITEIKSMINNKNFRKKLSFEESTIPCKPCANKKGKYALCWKGKRKTQYKYQMAPVELNDGSFIARRGKTTYLLDSKGNELFNAELDTFYAPEEYDKTYIGQKGDHWMIYSQSGEYSLPMTYIPNGFDVFRLHRHKMTRLEGKYFVVEGENDNKGIVDVNGRILIPYEFTELYADSTYGLIGNDWGTTSRAIGRGELDDEWTIFDVNFRPIGTIKAGDYFGIYGDFILFKKDKQIEAFHSLTLARDMTVFSESSMNHVFSEHKKGIVNNEGTLVVPANYEHIRKTILGNKEFYFCTTHSDKLDIFSISGNFIASFGDVDHYFLTCDEDPNYFNIASKLGGYRIIWFNQTRNTFVMLFDTKFVSTECSPDDALATAVKKESNGRKHYKLFRDGRMEVIEE